MNKETAAKIWFNFVELNQSRLRECLRVTSSKAGFINTRNALAEMGIEVTPQEMGDLLQFIQGTLDMIESSGNI